MQVCLDNADDPETPVQELFDLLDTLEWHDFLVRDTF